MDKTDCLYNRIPNKLQSLRIPWSETPRFIEENLKYPFFDWQRKAFESFLDYQQIKKIENPNQPTHLMFNMATGSGKTLLMAACLLYYYNKGYKHFIFFVNQNNIVDKTENNFLNISHTKYLFHERIVIEDKTIPIKKVEIFSDEPPGIEIKFTTIQKLYNDIHIVKENQTTLDNLNKRDIVMLADEAHHLNTDTKQKPGIQLNLIHTEITGKTGQQEIERRGWEHTVIELILKKNGQMAKNKNVLLEFTATIPVNKKIEKKYVDKIIYKFDLKDFLQAGYTKEINLISSTLEKKERVLQALLFHWYRHKIAIKHRIPNFKPVILFRSKTISDSRKDFEEFINWIEDLETSDFSFLKTINDKLQNPKHPNLYETGISRTGDVLRFINDEDIGFSEITHFIRENFKSRNVIITNSKDGTKTKEVTTPDQEKLLNSLEDRDNHIRAIFTVDRLTEGWDVLNLFDIVRLYQGQNAGGSTKKVPKATTKEKQLIGRGVRYFPFTYQDRIKNKRKFENELDNELRILEELFYYTYDEDSRYISHLKEELRRDGFIDDNKIIKTFKLKKQFLNSNYYLNAKIWRNEKLENPNRRRKTLDDLKRDSFMTYKLKNLELIEQEFKSSKNEDKERLRITNEKLKIITIKFKEIDDHIVRKAINIKAKSDKSLLKFNNLSKELKIKSIDDIKRNEFLGNFEINIIAGNKSRFKDIKNEDLLRLCLKFFDQFTSDLQEVTHPYIGSGFKKDDLKEIFGEDKSKIVTQDDESERIEEKLINKYWYVLDAFHGTSEEKFLISLIENTIGNLQKRYNEVFLLRNEEVYKIFDFNQGRGFQPDFLLFLSSKKENNLYYQIFIEPKGNTFIGSDGSFKSGKEGWKEEFLEEITEKYCDSGLLISENSKYKLIGLPFVNKDHNDNFEIEFSKLA